MKSAQQLGNSWLCQQIVLLTEGDKAERCYMAEKLWQIIINIKIPIISSLDKLLSDVQNQFMIFDTIHPQYIGSFMGK